MQRAKKAPSASVGDRMIEGLQQFVDVLKAKRPPSREFKCSKLTLSLKAGAYDAERVRETRAELRASRYVFAKLLGVSERTVRGWEQGTRTPNEMACRFMDEIRRDLPRWIKRLREAVTLE